MRRNLLILLAVLSLSLLLGCGGASSTPTISKTVPPNPTPTLTPTATPDHNPFQVQFLQHYQQFLCPPEPQLTAICYHLQDDPSPSSLGIVSFAGTDILYSRPEGSSCGQAERMGGFTLTDGDTIAIHATGPYCVPGYAVQFAFTVTGGTGHYQHAHGSGTISVGDASPTTAPEFWSGTITA